MKTCKRLFILSDGEVEIRDADGRRSDIPQDEQQRPYCEAAREWKCRPIFKPHPIFTAHLSGRWSFTPTPDWVEPRGAGDGRYRRDDAAREDGNKNRWWGHGGCCQKTVFRECEAERRRSGKCSAPGRMNRSAAGHSPEHRDQGNGGKGANSS